MIASPLGPGTKAHAPHNGLVAYAVVAGLLLIGAGMVRLRLPVPRESPYTAGSVRLTYSLMIGLGALLMVLAVRWRFFA